MPISFIHNGHGRTELGDRHLKMGVWSALSSRSMRLCRDPRRTPSGHGVAPLRSNGPGPAPKASVRPQLPERCNTSSEIPLASRQDSGLPSILAATIALLRRLAMLPLDHVPWTRSRGGTTLAPRPGAAECLPGSIPPAPGPVPALCTSKIPSKSDRTSIVRCHIGSSVLKSGQNFDSELSHREFCPQKRTELRW
jgi:hypothetical protein